MGQKYESQSIFADTTQTHKTKAKEKQPEIFCNIFPFITIIIHFHKFRFHSNRSHVAKRNGWVCGKLLHWSYVSQPPLPKSSNEWMHSSHDSIFNHANKSAQQKKSIGWARSGPSEQKRAFIISASFRLSYDFDYTYHCEYNIGENISNERRLYVQSIASRTSCKNSSDKVRLYRCARPTAYFLSSYD